MAAKLWFFYGCMGSSKSMNALAIRHNYIDKGKKVAFLKPQIECRDGEKVIRSRSGTEAKCEFVEEFLCRDLQEREYDVIIVDECQFLSREQVDKLSDIADFLNIPVRCYGLRTDFQGNLFEGSARLFELADEIEVFRTICWCGEEAQINARISDGHIVHDGAQVEMGGDDSYMPLCRRHFKQGKISREWKKSVRNLADFS